MRYNQVLARREVFFRDTPGAVGEAKPGIAGAAEGLRATAGDLRCFIPFGQTRLGTAVLINSAKGTKAVNRSKGLPALRYLAVCTKKRAAVVSSADGPERGIQTKEGRRPGCLCPESEGSRASRTGGA